MAPTLARANGHARNRTRSRYSAASRVAQATYSIPSRGKGEASAESPSASGGSTIAGQMAVLGRQRG